MTNRNKSARAIADVAAGTILAEVETACSKAGIGARYELLPFLSFIR